MSKPWKPNPNQLAAREPAQKLAEALGAKLPGEVPLDEVLAIGAAARKAGARWLMLTDPSGSSVTVSVSGISDLRKARAVLRRKRAVVTIQSDGVHVRWSTGRLRLEDVVAISLPRYQLLERALQVHIPARAGEEAA